MTDPYKLIVILFVPDCRQWRWARYACGVWDKS